MEDLRELLTDLAGAGDLDLDVDEVRERLASAVPAGDTTPILEVTLSRLAQPYRALAVLVLAAKGHREVDRWAMELLESPEPLARIDAAVACALLGRAEGERALLELVEQSFGPQCGHVSTAWIEEALAPLGGTGVADRVRARIAQRRRG